MLCDILDDAAQVLLMLLLNMIQDAVSSSFIKPAFLNESGKGPGGRGVPPYISCTDMCHRIGYGFEGIHLPHLSLIDGSTPFPRERLPSSLFFLCSNPCAKLCETIRTYNQDVIVLIHGSLIY